MAYEVDFRQVGAQDIDGGSKSGDAIAVRWVSPLTGTWRHMIIDGGYTGSGEALVDFMYETYRTDHVDVVVSTHPDADHINGLHPVLRRLNVDQLLLHRPRLSGYTDPALNAASDELAALAQQRGTQIIDPYRGWTFDGDAVQVVGPSDDWYRQCLGTEAAEVKTASLSSAGGWFAKAARGLLRRVLPVLPIEIPFDEDGGTSARNDRSIILRLALDDHVLLLTGDAGVPALERAMDYMDAYGLRRDLTFVQAPHHGSRHNVSSTMLDRLLYRCAGVCYVSAAADDEHHPHPRATNAFTRRGYPVYSTENASICHQSGTGPRPGWEPLTALPPLAED